LDVLGVAQEGGDLGSVVTCAESSMIHLPLEARA